MVSDRGWSGLWDRLRGRRTAARVSHADQFEHMSPAERRFVGESEEDRATGLETEAHLGGSDPDRLIDE